MDAKKYLTNEAKRDSWSHAYLLIGKEQNQIKDLVDYIIKSNKIWPEDVIEVSPKEATGKAGEIKIDSVRDALHQIYLTPNGEKKVAIFYHCQKLNQSSGNILLKTLEEPPKNAILILIAESDSVLPTIKSRCRVLNLTGPESSQEDVNNYLSIFNYDFWEASQKLKKVTESGGTRALLEVVESYCRDKLSKEKNLRTVKTIRSIWEIKNNLSSNCNLHLALECLYLNMRK